MIFNILQFADLACHFCDLRLKPTYGTQNCLFPPFDSKTKNTVVLFDRVFVSLMSATKIEAVMRLQGRNSSG